MATALLDQPSAPVQAHTPAARTVTPRSRMVAFVTTMVSSIVVVWVAVAVLTMTLAETSAVGAFGVGAFAAFWLGGGFGAIFGSAAAFGRDH